MYKSKYFSFFILVFLVSSIFYSCQDPSKTPVDKTIIDDEGGNEKHNEKTVLRFINNSSFDVSVYYGNNPYFSSSAFIEVPSKQSIDKEIENVSDYSTTFYYVYNLTFPGSEAFFPHYPNDDKINHKSLKLEAKKINNIYIDEIEECDTKSAYIFLENRITSEIYLLLQHTPVIPYKKESKFLDVGMTGAYEINDESTISFDNTKLLSLVVDSVEYSLPDINFEKGNIYTICVYSDDSSEKSVIMASLKAITPFNIDTQKKIWAFDDKLFDTNFSICMRPSYDKKSTIIMGTPKSDYTKVGFVKVDEYKNQEFNAENFIAYDFDKDSPYYLVESEVVDFIEQEDGSVVFLVSRLFTKKENVTSAGNLIDEDLLGQDYVISSYDFRNKKLYWYSYLSDMFFRNDSKNKLVPIEKDKYILVGSNYSQPEDFANNAYGYELIYVDASNPKAVAKTIINSMDEASYDDAGDGTTAEKERSLTSAYYDGTNLYFCGYENWEPKNYSTTHVGKIWKTTVGEITGKTFKFTDSSNVIYSHENCLFFSMDGIGSNFVVCGEYKDTGKILKGCFVSSREIAKNAECEPVLYVAKGKKHCWFNQLCQYNDKVVLCGIAGDDFGASVGALPFVVAYDYKNNKLWENLSFSDYTDALNIIPNTIGTYMLQLSGKNGIIHYVNADLLGNEVK
ncbi:MAG: hypothetical protein J5527_00910 [Treponema sp.]|nr:hypothetical protein [Treponema sp.]